MRRHRAGNDLLGTMEGCLAAVRKRADAAGITMDLAVPVNPALLRADTTPLGELGRYLLRYAISQARRGDRLLVRIDLTPEGVIALAIDEECAGVKRSSNQGGAGPQVEAEASVEPARAMVEAAGGRLSLSHNHSGGLHLLAMLPA